MHLRNRSRWMPRWLLLVSIGDDGEPFLCSYLARGASRTALAELSFPRRGLHPLTTAHLATLFPLGLFRKGMRLTLDGRLLVYPRLRQGARDARRVLSGLGETPEKRSGWGHDLHALRPMRPGDDPRRIHWKQSARTGKMIYMERRSERGRRVSVVVDNALDPSQGLEAEERLEERISDGATACLDFLGAGFDVELVTRSARLPFAGGARQRRLVLETLALLPAVEPADDPLSGHPELEVRFEAGPAEVRR